MANMELRTFGDEKLLVKVGGTFMNNIIKIAGVVGIWGIAKAINDALPYLKQIAENGR